MSPHVEQRCIDKADSRKRRKIEPNRPADEELAQRYSIRNVQDSSEYELQLTPSVTLVEGLQAERGAHAATQSGDASLMSATSASHITDAATISGFASFPTPFSTPTNNRLTLGLDRSYTRSIIVDPHTTMNVGSIMSLTTVQRTASDSNELRISKQMKQRLLELGITSLFAVQATLLPFLLSRPHGDPHLYNAYNPPPDVCISAPTGSGKTLAYVIPIVEILGRRTLTCLRALIVLPSRDLVVQVQETFEAVSRGRGLKIATVTGQQSFAHEQRILVGEDISPLRGGSSNIDILICTPGRLLDHLASTVNFSLQHLRFLVVDEADRLLAESYQGWLPTLLSAVGSSEFESDKAAAAQMGLKSVSEDIKYHLSLRTVDLVAPTFAMRPSSDFDLEASYRPQNSCQKLLFSATLTQDPGKIKRLQLRNPKYILVRTSTSDLSPPHGSSTHFEIPTQLIERYVITTSALKPLLLSYLILEHGMQNTLVFTKSTESASKLLNLLNQVQQRLPLGREKTESQVHEALRLSVYSSDLSQHERKTVLQKFRDHQLDLLVCSDLIARGIDISHVEHVVSYDTPLDMRKYLHRVGRTARAGRQGSAWSLVEEQEARHFKAMLTEAGHIQRLQKVKIAGEKLTKLQSSYHSALRDLQNKH